jgi:hypothetical protein
MRGNNTLALACPLYSMCIKSKYDNMENSKSKANGNSRDATKLRILATVGMPANAGMLTPAEGPTKIGMPATPQCPL